MSHLHDALAPRARRARNTVLLLALGLLHCSSSSSNSDQSDSCFPDADGVTGGAYTINLTVDDAGFSKNVLNTQNNATVTFTLTNAGTLPHGFEVDCVDVTSEYPHLPAGCPRLTCFPEAATIAPLAPGESTTVGFVTPTTDTLIYPFKSSAPDDATVPGLTRGQWSLM